MESRVEPALDFLSPEFDAERALRSDVSRLVLPCPNVKPCDNLQAYESLISGTKRPHDPPAEANCGPIAEVLQSKPLPRRIKPIKTVLNVMEGDKTTGPLALLQRWWREQNTVCVWIRHAAGVRGTCKGKLVAFDKHFNMVLEDVHEDYTPFRSVENGGKISGKRKKDASQTANEDNCRSVRLHRHCPVLFIRGDNVVVVNLPSE